MSSPIRPLLLLLLAALGPALAASAGPRQAAGEVTIERRGAVSPLRGGDFGFDEEGVWVRTAGGAENRVPWDRVRAVSPPPAHPDFADRMERAERLWRARVRLERDDTLLAEPILRDAFEEAPPGTRTGETALLVAEGLLRCRLARGDQAGALLPALETARLRRAGIACEPLDRLPPVLDLEYALAPRLAPVVVADLRLARAKADLEAYSAGMRERDPVVAALAEGYRAAVELDEDGRLGEPPGPPLAPDAEAAEHRGVALLHALARAQSADAAERSAARAALLAMEAKAPAWADAWIRFGEGASLLREPDPGQHRAGVVALLHVPAREGRHQPWLSGAALVAASAALAEAGDDEGATVLQRELDALLPYHPLRVAAPPASASTLP